MELASIEKLLEKYLNATTSVQEEEILKKYFNSKEVAPHLKEYGMMFEYFKQSKSETFTKTIQLKPKNFNQNLKKLKSKPEKGLQSKPNKT